MIRTIFKFTNLCLAYRGHYFYLVKPEYGIVGYVVLVHNLFKLCTNKHKYIKT